MKVTEFEIKGPKLIELTSFGDSRGFFVERYHEDRFREAGITAHFVQDNYSRSEHGTLRGLHYQYDHPQAKLVTATRGTILDVVVDLRSKSPTFGQHLKVEISGDQPAWFWVPAGFAHGFLVLSSEGADVLYKVDAYYNPKGESGVSWDDPRLKVNWPTKQPSLSARDKALATLSDYEKDPRF